MAGKRKQSVMRSSDDLAAEFENAAALRIAATIKSFPDGQYTVRYPGGESRVLRFTTVRRGKSHGAVVIGYQLKTGGFLDFGWLFRDGMTFFPQFKEEQDPARLERIVMAVQRVVEDPESARVESVASVKPAEPVVLGKLLPWPWPKVS
jgi:hypothetical protein